MHGWVNVRQYCEVIWGGYAKLCSSNLSHAIVLLPQYLSGVVLDSEVVDRHTGLHVERVFLQRGKQSESSCRKRHSLLSDWESPASAQHKPRTQSHNTHTTTSHNTVKQQRHTTRSHNTVTQQHHTTESHNNITQHTQTCRCSRSSVPTTRRSDVVAVFNLQRASSSLCRSLDFIKPS